MNKQLCSRVRRYKLWRITGMMLVAGIAMAVTHSGRGAIAYLPSIGPAPLRFEVAADPDTTFAWKLLRPLPQTGDGSRVPVPEAATVTNATNAVVFTANSLAVTNDTITAASTSAADPATSKNLETPPGSMFLPMSSDEFSSPVTAQILAGFFKPASGERNLDGTNLTGIVVSMPANIGFTPPLPGPAPASKAVYKSQ